MEAPFLAREEERGLALRWKDKRDERALHRLISAHMRLVIALAGRFRHYGLPMADLVQEGHVGLMEAAARFEPERDVRFSTYATWWIRASIQDYILRNWSIVRGGTSSAQKALFFNLRRLRARLMQSTEERVGDEIHRRIATAIGVSREDVALMDARLSGPDMSLNAPVGEESEASSERMDFLVDGAALPDETVSATVDGERRLIWLQQALTVLSERELRILQERRLAEDQATLEALGHRLGISKERVRQIENRALEKLRRALAEKFPQTASSVYAG
ncbi:RNA polymerase factor sigma-32 [Methylobacterium oxalidis]|uniref:RNA polymerase factor sigma-32 n=2 Tax=Methylobacterium oxalidis TaxID=944322 RepID=A0A512J4R2_9HYPH|nr:RNA polymerase factor sigma-32 [Methylobacterium oxalidis]GLS63693.1 RNA polymerase factor sigma-32 [Methylobacterium oxalidis]